MIPLNDPTLLRQQAYLDGAWSGADSGATLEVRDPANGVLLGTVPAMGAAETGRAIASAERAQQAWRQQTGKARAQVLLGWLALVRQHAEDMACLMTYEQGKPLAEARGEIAYAASFIEWFAEEAKRVDGDTLQSPWPQHRLMVLKEPVGVCAAITPWNFPAAMVTRKVAPALAAGCAVVLKPAEATPFSALALAALAERAGLPAGLLNVVTGPPQAIGAALCASPVVRKLSFTGSTAVGRLLMQQCAPTLKKLSLELGGNAPFIVFDDADLDAAVEGALVAKFRNSGQTCVCANRLYVQAGVYDAFAAKLAARVAQLTLGHGAEAGVTQGPLINDAAVAKVEAHIADAWNKGAQILTGGRRHALGRGFFQPTVLTGVREDMLVAHEETFGPLAPLFRFECDEDAIAQANATEFGLAGYLYARDIGRIWRAAGALETGMLGINTGMISNEVGPFGGVKQSGMGREGSKYGIDDYLVLKYLCFSTT